MIHADDGAVGGGLRVTARDAGEPVEARAVRGVRGLRAMAWQATLPMAAAIVLGFGALVGVRYVARPIALLIIAVAIAEALVPVVAALSRRLPRGLAIGLVYLVLVSAAAGVLWIVVPALVAQGQELVRRAPQLAEQAREWTDRGDQALGIQLSVLFATAPQWLSGVLVRLPLQVAGGLLDVLLVGFLSAYWLVGAPALQRFALSLLPSHRREAAGGTLRAMGEAMGGYVRGAAINALVMGLLAWAGLAVIGVPYALTLGVITLLLEPIPVLGPLLAAVPVVVVAFLQSPSLALVALGLYVVLQQVEGHVLTPNIMRRQTDMPQTLVIFALLAGGAVGGLLGVLAAIPAAAGLRVLVLRVVAPAIRRATGAAPSPEAAHPAAPHDAAVGAAAPPAGRATHP